MSRFGLGAPWRLHAYGRPLGWHPQRRPCRQARKLQEAAKRLQQENESFRAATGSGKGGMLGGGGGPTRSMSPMAQTGHMVSYEMCGGTHLACARAKL